MDFTIRHLELINEQVVSVCCLTQELYTSSFHVLQLFVESF